MFINLTPHVLNILTPSGVRELPPSGRLARVSMVRTPIDSVDGVPIETVQPGPVVGLDDPKDGVYLIVSGMVAGVVRRPDVFSPGELIRGEDGQPVGCKGLVRSC